MYGKVTKQERLIIQEYLEYYYDKFAESEEGNKTPLSFKVQMRLLYDHLSQIEE
tara:strand:- start:266 stop:427 length:162 start_codon:yes stop_codon:yes gene_type:complete